MRSIVEEALARSALEGRTRRGDYSDSEYSNSDSDTDAELEEILRSLKTTIKVVGCGGGGSNSIQRMMGEGIQGADLVAIILMHSTFFTSAPAKRFLSGGRKRVDLEPVASPR